MNSARISGAVARSQDLPGVSAHAVVPTTRPGRRSNASGSHIAAGSVQDRTSARAEL